MATLDGPLPTRKSLVRAWLCRSLLQTVLVLGLPGLATAEAGSRSASDNGAAASATRERAAAQGIEWRRALSAGSELPPSSADRRRLSADQSRALNRELRETLRGIYDERGAAKRPR